MDKKTDENLDNKRVFLTFSDKRLHRSLNRIVKEAKHINFFDEIFAWDEDDLSKEFKSFFANILHKSVRGFGFWCWKPQVILQALELLDDGDILLYADVGFTINPNGKARLEQYFDSARESSTGIVAFQGRRPEPPMFDDGRELPTWPDSEWTKADLFKFFSVESIPEIVDSPTIQAGLILIRKCPESKKIIEDWLSVFYFDLHLVDDSPSKSENFPGFREHRHDQSVFSILGKINSIYTFSSNEFWFPKTMSSAGDWKALDFSPFHATRSLDFGFWGNSKRKALFYANALKPKNLAVSVKLFISRISKQIKH